MEMYAISGETLEKCLEALRDSIFSENGDYTNDKVVEAIALLEKEMKR